eukprot:87481_1
MVYWILSLFLYVIVKSRSYHPRARAPRLHRYHVQSAKMSLEDRLEHQEFVDIFALLGSAAREEEMWMMAATDPIKFGTNDLKIGKSPTNLAQEERNQYKTSGAVLMGDDLTAVFVYGELIYHAERISNKAEKEEIANIYEGWKAVKPTRRGLVVVTWGGQKHDLFDMWNTEKNTVDSQYTQAVWSIKNTASKTKWTHGISAGTLRAVAMYTNDHHNRGGKILRRLFYDYGTWSQRMTPQMLEKFRNFGAKLYQATHSFRTANVLNYIHKKVKKDPDEYRFDSDESPKKYLYLYHGASIGALNAVDGIWNPEGKSIWWGPTSTTIKVDVASDTDYGRKGIVFEIRVPMDPNDWPDDADFGLMAAMMYSSKNNEEEVLVWNILTEWMTPIKSQGKWFTKTYFAGDGTTNLVKWSVQKMDDAKDNIQELYAIHHPDW